MSLHNRSIVLLQNLRGSEGSDQSSESLRVVTMIGRSLDTSLNKVKHIRDSYSFISSWNPAMLEAFSNQISSFSKAVSNSTKDFSVGENNKVLNRQKKLEKPLQDFLESLKSIEETIVADVRNRVSAILVDDYKVMRLKAKVPPEKAVRFDQLSRDLSRLAVCNRSECPNDLSDVKGKIVEYTTLVSEYGEEYPLEVEKFIKRAREKYSRVTLKDLTPDVLEFLQINNLAVKFEIKEQK